MSRSRAKSRGLTLLEVLVSISILALMSTLIYGALDGMSKAKKGLSRIDERYQQGRSALMRISRELQSAFISLHQPLVASQSVSATAFVGKHSSPTDRIDFNSFSHRRFTADVHESDQNELSYFGSRDPDVNKLDLVRRESKTLDLDPGRGGIVNVVAEDIESFTLEYLDPLTSEWTDSWDSTQAAEQFMRLPMQVKITLVLNGGIGDKPLTLVTKTSLGMQLPISFAGSP